MCHTIMLQETNNNLIACSLPKNISRGTHGALGVIVHGSNYSYITVTLFTCGEHNSNVFGTTAFCHVSI